MIASSFAQVVDIKKYFNDYVILNICESSTTGELYYIGVSDPCHETRHKHLLEIDGIWFHVVCRGRKVAKRYCQEILSMGANMKACICAPTKKKTRKRSKHGLRELLILSSSTIGGTPQGHLKGHLRDKGRDQPRIRNPPKNSKEATIEDLLQCIKAQGQILRNYRLSTRPSTII